MKPIKLISFAVLGLSLVGCAVDKNKKEDSGFGAPSIETKSTPLSQAAPKKESEALAELQKKLEGIEKELESIKKENPDLKEEIASLKSSNESLERKMESAIKSFASVGSKMASADSGLMDNIKALFLLSTMKNQADATGAIVGAMKSKSEGSDEESDENSKESDPVTALNKKFRASVLSDIEAKLGGDSDQGETSVVVNSTEDAESEKQAPTKEEVQALFAENKSGTDVIAGLIPGGILANGVAEVQRWLSDEDNREKVREFYSNAILRQQGSDRLAGGETRNSFKAFNP